MLDSKGKDTTANTCEHLKYTVHSRGLHCVEVCSCYGLISWHQAQMLLFTFPLLKTRLYIILILAHWLFLHNVSLMFCSLWRGRFTFSSNYGLYLFEQFNHLIFLQSAKMFNYGTGWRKTCDTLFVVFAVVFLVTRLVIFPSKWGLLLLFLWIKCLTTVLNVAWKTHKSIVRNTFFNIA